MTGNAKRKTLNGKSYLVAPVSMIVPGVLTGSKGSLHYPQDMVARNAGRWENIPLTLGHPSDPLTNTPQSASDPGVVDRVGLGFVCNDRFATGKHRAEAWFDEDATRRKAPDVYAALNSGQRMEVSTGLFTQEEARDGTWNGRAYTHVVQGYQPDHLAILPNQRGACSVNDGCGLNVNAAATTSKPTKTPKPIKAATVGSPEATSRVQAYIENDGEIPPQHPDLPVSEPKKAETPPPTAPVGNDGCPCGGTCRNCMAKNTVTEPLADQPRCPIKQTFQPRGFKGRGRGEVHTAAKAGMSDTGVNADTEDKETDVTTKPGVTVQNSNPEGVNQYTGGGSGDSKSEKEAAILHATKDMHSSKSLGTKAAAKSSQLAAMKGTPAAHVEAMQHHTRLAEKHGGSGNAEKAAAHHNIAQLHHDAALTTNQPTNNDRSSGQTKGESDMDRKAMIQHLTTNCDCYKGKQGAVLNQLTDEMLTDIINNHAAVELAKSHLGDRNMTTNAMPAALKAAMDKKKGGDTPDEEDDEDDAPPTKNSAPAAKPTLEQHLLTLPREVRNLVRNALAAERRQKEEYVEVLTANVEGDAKQVLANHYLKLPVDVLKAQVDALPQQTQNTGEYEFVDAAPVYNAAALSGYDRGANNTRRGGVGEVMLDD